MSRFFVFIFSAFLFLAAAAPSHAALSNDVQSWLALRDMKREFDFQTYARFLTTHKEWPEYSLLSLRAEQELLRNVSSEALVSWFKDHKPVTDEGRARYALALVQVGKQTEASQYIRQQWRDGFFGEVQQSFVLQNFRSMLTQEDHEARLDNLLWQGRLDRAQRGMNYVSDVGKRAAANLRMNLQRMKNDAPSAFSSLPSNARQENGLLFDMARYWRQKGDDQKAASYLNQRKGGFGNYASVWWRERNLLARRALERGDYQRAYSIASHHGHTSGVEFADAEWLSGWLAVTRLKQPQKAFDHFEHMERNVKTPISISRASYWAGIAADQMGQKDLAAQWYRAAARHMNTFYGQLGAYALGNAQSFFSAFFQRNQSVGPAAEKQLRGDLAGAARLLNRMGRTKERDMFLRAALRVANEAGHPQAVIPLARELHSPSMALIAAKAAYDKGILIGDALFPRTKVPGNADVEPALALGIIRQESLFDPMATSTANARGLMQVLPGTARHVAAKSGIKHSNDAQLYQASHNMQLGQAYLARLLNAYDGFVPLVAASYNAGPGNVAKWLDTMGDPRKDPYSWVDWVERIPFYETRNYVQRVWENYLVYKYMLSAR